MFLKASSSSFWMISAYAVCSHMDTNKQIYIKETVLMVLLHHSHRLPLSARITSHVICSQWKSLLSSHPLLLYSNNFITCFSIHNSWQLLDFIFGVLFQANTDNPTHLQTSKCLRIRRLTEASEQKTNDRTFWPVLCRNNKKETLYGTICKTSRASVINNVCIKF